ncbi:MAG: anaerobic ribonucleoside-triphosphate reductase activating protein [Mycoplasmataceae bacterium]|nr:anaerobic ribonucleoside-triphosphate reductase activating protein [Mycoplasmataceae bacterium]
MVVRIANIYPNDVDVNGPGIRTVIFSQGCKHHCPYCFNKETWDFDKGKEYDVSQINEIVKKNSVITDGVTLSGGDPFFQSQGFSLIAEYAKKLNLNVWAYTGFTFEQLLELAKKEESVLLMLKNIDVLVDGKFEQAKKVKENEREKYPFRGSKNQRMIDVSKSLEVKKTVLYKL